MTGPFEFILTNVKRLVARRSAGAYILSRGKNPASGNWKAHYVGRSDDDLQRRLLEHVAAQRYAMFWFEYAANAREAFEFECRWWHDYKPDDNQIHPAAPANSGFRCPVPGCPFSRAA